MASSSSSSTTFYYRQKAPANITMFHEVPPFTDMAIQVEGVNQLDVPTLLCKLVKEKNRHCLNELGGVEGIKTNLQSDGQRGICVGNGSEEITRRKETYGTNSYGGPPPKSFFCFLLSKPFKDAPMIVIMAFAILSIGLGIKKHGLGRGWYDNDGGSIVVSVVVVISVTAIGDFMQYKQFRQLAEIRNDFSVEVVRNGRPQSISFCGVVVGDVVFLKMGDQVPADGIFVEGHSLVVDESCVTGQSIVEINRDTNPFLLSGSKVVHGYAKMMVTCVGTNTLWGEIMKSTTNQESDQEEETPLQVRLHELATCIDIIGKAVAFLVLVVLLLRYFTGNTEDENGDKAFNGNKTKADDIINAVAGIIVTATTILVVATPKGLPSVVALTPAFCMKRTMSDQALLRKLRSSEIMGSATRICMDMTSILLPNQMRVSESFVGREYLEDRSYTSIADNVRKLLVQGIGLTTGCARKLFTITSVDDAIHNWAVTKLNMEMDQSTNGLSILHVDASCLERKRIGVLAKEDADNTVHVHWRGDFERIFSVCSHYYGINGDHPILLDDEERENFRQTIEMMADRGLHCIALAHKHLSQEEYDQINEPIPSNDLILLGLVGVKRHCLPGVKQAIEICQLANVKVIMITSENVSTARAIATECGVISHFPEVHDAGSTTVAGRQFRSFSNQERIEIVESINIMARSSPIDKHLLVQCLRSANEVVAVTGDAGGDVPALREADIGLAMGIKGTQSVKENSDIVILDDNFASVATVLRTGRCVRRNVEKLIQFQITAILAALVITLVTVVFSGKTLMTPAQFLWLNLTTNALGLLALAAEKPSERLMYEPPRRGSDPLITNIMWRNIMCQALYQITMILALEFKGKSIFATNENVNDTLVFNTFILCQVFNRFNARKLEDMNIFKGILKNKIFLGVTGITIIFQVMMVEFLNKLAHTERLDWTQWGVCTGIAVFSWPIGLIAKFVPVPGKPIC